LYWFCMATNRVQPPRPAVCWSFANCQAYMEEAPRVADLASFDDVVQGLHRLLGRAVRIEAMDLVKVDVVGAEPGQGSIGLLEDRLAGQALPAGAVVHLAEHLSCQHDVLAPGVALDGATDQLLGGAVLIHVRGVPEGDARLDGPGGRTAGLRRRPGPSGARRHSCCRR